MLKGKTALITGSTSGIGLAIAKAFAEKNANLVISGLGEEKTIADECKMLDELTSGRIKYISADMSKPHETKKLMQEAEKEFGSIDILVNNVGIQKVNPIEDYPDDMWEKIIAINLSASFYTTKAVLPGMRLKKWGRIINIASAHGLIASPFKSAYVAAKHGLVGLTKVTALETAEEGITCNAICPGFTWTKLVENQLKDIANAKGIPIEEVIEKVMMTDQPTKKFVQVEELAALAVYLCQDSAKSITGASLPVDGAWTAH